MDFSRISRLSKQLLVTLVDNGSPTLLARYVMLSDGRVTDSGECEPMDLPYATEARVVYFFRNGYFNSIETEVSNTRTLPFQARRLIESAMAFNESFKARFASTEISPGRYRLDMAAAANEDIHAALNKLPVTTLPFTRFVLAETAIAALVYLETNEPAIVLWMRNGVIVGQLIKNGVVLARTIDRPAADYTASGSTAELNTRLERVRSTIGVAARRRFPEREPQIVLAFGELLGKIGKEDGISRALESRLSKRFPGAETDEVLLWPELFGLSVVPSCYSLLDPDYQEEALVSRFATRAGIGLLALGILLIIAGFWQYYNSYYVRNLFINRNASLEVNYADFKKQLPSQEQIHLLKQQWHKSGETTDFRADEFLAWVSHITPEAAMIHRLDINTSGTAPEASPTTQNKLPLVTIEWDVAGDYPGIEKLTADMLVALGIRTQLSDSRLEYKPGGNARFTTKLTPVAGAFRE